MISHRPAKYGGHTHRGSGDINISATTLIYRKRRIPHSLDIRDCIYPLTSGNIIFSKAHRENNTRSHTRFQINYIYDKQLLFRVSNQIGPVLVRSVLANNF